MKSEITHESTVTLKPLIAILFIFHALGIGAHAQEAKSKTCRILFLGRPASAPVSLHLFDGTRSQEVELPGMNVSPVYKLPAGNLALTLLPSPPTGPEQLPGGAPAAKVAETITDFYLIVTSDEGNKVAPVRMNIIGAPKDQLRPGTTLWFNLTGYSIAGNLGEGKLTIRPHSSAIMDPPRNGDGDYPVIFRYQDMNDKVTYPICETRWMHDPRSRGLGFIYMQGDSRTPRIQLFADFRNTPEPE